jgi:TolB-like protein/tetratricopeptide (TPR) repeat protein
MTRLQQLVAELRRRRIFRAAGIFIVAGWVAVQVASLVFPAVNVPDAALRYVWIAVILLFPLVIVFAWFYDLTPAGLVRTPPAHVSEDFELSLRRADYLILSALAMVGIAITWQLTESIRDTEPGTTFEYRVKDIHPNSIAVLPLENLSGDPEQQYFVSGMQDALIAGLSRISALKVTSKTSTMQYQDTVLAIPRIAAQLGVAKLIEGTIYKVDDRVRITVKLVDARADEHIWTETFENDVKDVMMLQNEVALAIAQQVEVTITPVEKAQMRSAKSVNPAAYEAFLKGQFHVERFTPQDMMLAAQYYQQALNIDPDYPLAHWGLSKLCGFQAQVGLITPVEAHARCLPPIEKALALDDSLPEAHMGYASHMTWQQFNWREAGAAFERAIELNPSYAEAHMFYSQYLTLIGRGEEGSKHIRMALELDPLNPFVHGLYGAQLLMIDDPQGAIRVLEEVMASTPGFGFGYHTTWVAYHVLGEKDKAIAAAANDFRITRGDPTGALALEEAYVGGDYSGALLHAAEVLAERSKTVHVSPMTIGTLYEQAGHVEKAIDWFEIAYRKRDPDAPFMGVMTKSPSLHSSPRFIKLLREMKLDYWADKYSQPEV